MSYTLYDQIIKEKRRILKEIATINHQLSKLPKGELTCNRNGKYVKWFCTINHTRNYISKGERDLAEKLAEKKYLLTLKDDLEQELEICTNINNKQKVFSPKHRQLLEQKEYADLLKKHFSSKYHKYRDWMNEEYEKNTSHPETLIHDIGDGLTVRSKAEAMIATTLKKYHIPFRYECGCQLRSDKVYPDFTIIHPKTGKIYLWEHLGMMDDRNYSSDQFIKLKKYNDAGWTLGINLIVTTETKDEPLTYLTIENKIKEFFLD